MLRYCYTVLFTLCSFHLFAASVKGTVVDSKNNQPLSGVVVSLTGTPKGSVSDFDGKYEIADLSDGTYEIVFTYATFKTYKQSITIAGNLDVVFDMKMMPETQELSNTVIKSSRITNTENSVINEIKASNTIVSGTSAAQISKTMDRNAADVVKRIPGVTIQDDRFVVIRGLPDRYNTVWLNDASTPSSESDKKSFSFDIIPAGLIDRVLVFKTPSPDLPGDFAGGMVKVYTTSLADRNQLTVSLQTSSREYTTGTDFNYNNPGKYDWLGFDDGKRNIPGLIPGFVSSKDPDYKANISTWSKSFGNDWIVNTGKANPDARLSLALSNVWKLKKIKIGNTLGVAYSNTYTNFNIHRQTWDSIAKDNDYMDKKSDNTVSSGIMDNVGVSIGNSKIELKNLYNQIGKSSLTIRRTVFDSTSPNPDEKGYAMGYESRATYASQLTGTHKNKTDTRKYTWTLGYTDLFKNQPDLRRIRYTKSMTDADSMFKASVPSSVDILNGGRWYSTLYEHTYSFNHQFTQKINVTKNYSFEASIGNYLEYKTRSFQIRQLGYTIKPGANTQRLLRLPINEIFADSNVDGLNKFKIGEVTNDYDHYDGKNQLIASYLTLKLPVGDRVTIFGGARYEYNIQSLSAVVNLDTLNPEIKTKYLLPSVNASYNFSDKSLVRIAYGKTLNRPEFREWAPSYYYDFDEMAGLYGSLYPNTANKTKTRDTLKVAEIQNIDVRYELYPHAGEMLQLGVFYKSFKNPIQRIIITSGGFDYSFINADNATCYGFELDVRKSLAFADTLLGTNIFRDFAFVGNLSLVKSELNIDTSRINLVVPKSTMQGQSPYIVNAGLYYQNLDNGFQGSLLYNVYGARVYAIGNATGSGVSRGEMPFQSFDFTIAKTFLKRFVINFGIQNILNSRVVLKNDTNRDDKFDSKNDLEVKTFYPGRYYSLGIKVKL